LSRRYYGAGSCFRVIFVLKAYQKITILIIVILCCFHQNINAQDTLSVSKSHRKIFNAEPMRATMLAVSFPGLGQIYNRKYWKVPLVYAGFGGLIYAIGFNSHGYNTFMTAYQDFTDNIRETDSYLKLIKNVDPSTYDPVLYPDTYIPANAQWYKDRMIRQVDYFKKYRDLSYIGIAAWYLITVLDANVDASLFNFNVKDNLELKVEPVIVPLSVNGNMIMNLCLRVTF
jgi:hypothetical protein